MSGSWPPPIAEPELIERLALDDAGFRDYMRRVIAHVPSRVCDADAVARALGYPWERPAGSYLLADGDVQPLTELPEAQREALIERHSAPEAGRVPLLAIGANGAPGALKRKLAHFDDVVDRTVLVVTGRLHDFDVGFAAHPALYGALPATIFASPGTAVAAALLWVTPAQFTQLTWSELSYAIGRLRTRFEVGDADEAFDEVLVFVSRWGALCIDGDGAPAALAAVPAHGRTATPLTQRQALGRVAALALGAQASAEALVQAIFDDFPAVAAMLGDTLQRQALPFASERWTPFAGVPR